MSQPTVGRSSLNAIEREAWDTLAQTNAVNRISHVDGWYSACWEAFSSDHDLALFAACDSDWLVSIESMVIDVGGTLRLLGRGSSDYLDLLIADDLRDVLATLRSRVWHHRWKRMLLDQVHQQSLVVGPGSQIPSFVK